MAANASDVACGHRVGSGQHAALRSTFSGLKVDRKVQWAARLPQVRRRGMEQGSGRISVGEEGCQLTRGVKLENEAEQSMASTARMAAQHTPVLDLKSRAVESQSETCRRFIHPSSVPDAGRKEEHVQMWKWTRHRNEAFWAFT